MIGAAEIRCRAILFDMDGTLVDSTTVVRSAWEWWAKRHGVPLAPVLATQTGRPHKDVMREFIPHLDVEEESRQFIAFEENDTESLRAVPGAIEAVQAAQQGRWGIVTSAGRKLAEIRLRTAGIPVPGVLITHEMLRQGKPDPEGFLLAATRLEVRPEECVVLEDAPAGVLAARRCGMPVIGVGETLGSEPGIVWRVRDLHVVRIECSCDGWFSLSQRG